MITILKLLFTNVSTLCLFQVASNFIELLKVNIITFINQKDQSVVWKYVLNIILFAILSLFFIAIIDMFM
jgi:hypothetical protein